MDFRLAELVWEEDDVTCSDPAHETVWVAYHRLYGGSKSDALRKQDCQDVVYYTMPDDVVVAGSYPGNSAIYDFKKTDGELVVCSNGS